MTQGGEASPRDGVGPHLARLLVQRIEEAIDALDEPRRCLGLVHPDDRELIEGLPWRAAALRSLPAAPPALVFASLRDLRFAAIGVEPGVLVIAPISDRGDEPAAARVEIKRA